MRHINLETWPRRQHFEFFSGFDHPHFGMCADVDLTAFYPAVKQRGCSMTLAIVYVIARASNAIPEFRYRIRAGSIVEHDVVHPGFTIMVDEDLFSFCMVDYAEEFSVFAGRAAERIACVKEHPWVYNPARDDVLYMTAIAWGKFFKDDGILKMPLSVHGHHALMDGVHLGRFYAKVQEYLHQPEVVLGEPLACSPSMVGEAVMVGARSA